jgi:hypothetical protein
LRFRNVTNEKFFAIKTAVRINKNTVDICFVQRVSAVIPAYQVILPDRIVYNADMRLAGWCCANGEFFAARGAVVFNKKSVRL